MNPWLRDLNRGLLIDRVVDAVAELASAFVSAGIRPPVAMESEDEVRSVEIDVDVH